MKPRVYDDLVQSAVELSCFGTGQSTIEEGREAYQTWLAEHDRQIAEQAFELGCVAVDAEEHGVGCRFTVGQLEELSRDYGRDAYSVNNPYGRGES